MGDRVDLSITQGGGQGGFVYNTGRGRMDLSITQGGSVYNTGGQGESVNKTWTG